MAKRLLTGDRCTGPLHIGHYAGKLVPLLDCLQQGYEAFIMVADYHAMTTHYARPSDVRKFSRDVVIDYLAAGIDPACHTIFIQSQMPEHLELAYFLGCLTPVSHLERVPTYKEKVQEINQPPSLALLGYPVLMTSDIMVYRGEAVPVGEDQVPHLELAREIIRRFNQTYGMNFPEPHPVLGAVARLKGIDGAGKMGKSIGNQIDLRMSGQETTERIRNMLTDPQRIRRSDHGRPDVCPVYQYYQAFASDEASVVAEECRSASRGCVDCKKRLAVLVNEFFAPLRERQNEYLKRPAYIDDILADGGKRARAVARESLQEILTHTGFALPQIFGEPSQATGRTG